jgi:lysophospholipid acyltransferase (LPLAT)-like uncharacterized protein
MASDNSEAASAGGARPRLSQRLSRLPWGVNAAGGVLAAALKFVYATNRITFDAMSREAVFERYAPFILAFWHGQAFTLPVVRLPQWPVDVLVSKSLDAEIIARVVGKLGLGVIRGSGSADPARMFEKGGIDAFRAMKASLDQGRSVALTADFMRDARQKVSPGVILLARLTGRPIIPIGVASSRRFTFNSWDRTTIALPFGHTAFAMKEPLTVPRQVSEAELEATRLELEARINGAFDRAYEIVGGQHG